MKTRDSLIYNPLAGNFLGWWIGFCFMAVTTYANGAHGWVDLTWPFISGITIASLWTIRLHAYQEALRIKRKKTIHHGQRVLQRFLIAVGIGLTIHCIAEGYTRSALIHSGLCATYMLSVFWMTFDFILNYDRGKELFYVSNWYRTSRLDKLFSKIDSPVLWLVSKILGFSIFLYLYAKSFTWEF